MPRFVVKRDGRLAEWRDSKVVRAVIMAARDAASRLMDDHKGLKLVSEAVADCLGDRPTINEVHAAVVEVLKLNGYEAVAHAYDAYRTNRDAVRALDTRPDNKAIADYILTAKYARLMGDGRRESREQVHDRVFSMHNRRWHKHQAVCDRLRVARVSADANRIRGSMRSMQFAGRAIETNNLRMYNCAFTHVNRVRVFQETFYALLAGCGVGYSVQFHHVERLPKVVGCDPRRVVHYRIDDTIEGWADALGALVTAHMVHGHLVCFDYSMIRPEGAPLTTSGGVAPGHQPLKDLLDLVHSYLSERRGRRLRPIECHDLMCMAAEAVLSGGIRRSSLICLFSEHDSEMLYAKADGNFVPRGVPGMAPKNWWREMANNSMILPRCEDNRASFKRVMAVAADNYGDPGVFFTHSLEHGCNPCGEIGLDPRLLLDNPHWVDSTHNFDWKTYTSRRTSVAEEAQASFSYDELACAQYGATSGFQFCNLCEVNVAACATQAEFAQACADAAFLGTLQAAYDEFPYLGPVTERVVRRDALIGVGLTGIMDRPDIGLDPELLRSCSDLVLRTNADWAVELGIRPAARCTTVKPSGTASLELGGVGSGIHPHHAARYFRRVTANPNEAPAKLFRETNPHMVDVKPNGDLSIVFPIQPIDGALTKDMPALEFVDHVMTVYENWVKPGTRDTAQSALTHNVSATVVMSESERAVVENKLWDERHRLAAISFAPRDIDDRFPFIPLRAVRTAADEVVWATLISNYVPVDWSKLVEGVSSTTLAAACDGGKCEVTR